MELALIANFLFMAAQATIQLENTLYDTSFLIGWDRALSLIEIEFRPLGLHKWICVAIIRHGNDDKAF